LAERYSTIVGAEGEVMTHQQSQLDPNVEFEEDPRYAIANREALIGIAYWAAFTIVVSGLAWGLGGNRKAADLGFLLGFPEWFFWSCIIGAGVMSLVPIWLVRQNYTDLSLNADENTDSTDTEATE
jgi:uncharacterized membrane protein YhdT